MCLLASLCSRLAMGHCNSAEQNSGAAYDTKNYFYGMIVKFNYDVPVEDDCSRRSSYGNKDSH